MIVFQEEIMPRSLTLLISGMLVLSFLLTACGGEADPAAQVPVVTQETAGFVTAEAVVRPARSVTLRAAIGGRVVELGAAEAEGVDAGRVLLRIDSADARLAVRKAEAGLAQARAGLAAARAGARTEQIAVLEARLAAAEAAVAQAVALRDEQAAGLIEADVVDAQAQLAAAASAHRQAGEAHDETLRCFDVSLPVGGVQTICPALGPYEEMTRFQLEAAYGGLVAAQAQLDALQGSIGPQADAAEAAVRSAAARRDGAQAGLDLARAGSRGEEIALAEAAVELAEAALGRARALLDLCTIESPFGGTVVDLAVDTGDTVTAGEPLVTLATLDRLQVETTDLAEADVVRVAVGQAAVVSVDALPGRTPAGRVVRVDWQGVSYFGDVVYPVVVELDGAVPALLWGMSASVAIDVAAEGAAGPGAGSGGEVGDPVIAEAAVEPARWSGLRFVIGGRVSEIPAAEGDRVDEGDVLVRLDPVDALLAVQEAEAALAAEEARLALALAGPRAEEVAAARALLAAAQGDLGQAEALRDQLAGGGLEAEVAGARAELEAARAAWKQAQVAADRAGDGSEGDALREQLAVAALEVKAAEARVEALASAIVVRLRAAGAAVQAARAQADVARAELDLLEAGAAAAEVDAAEARVQQAGVVLSEAELALERTALRAPFAGSVTQVLVEVGDSVGAGQVVLVMAAPERMQLVTTDLGELDVVRVAEGQSVVVRVDALPGRPLRGHVARVQLQSVDVRGDVTYPVVIELDEAAPDLLWGMTAVVEIEGR
jgi:multidrug resistance efflux pump